MSSGTVEAESNPTFIKFGDFPIDIRLLIWEAAIAAIPARIVGLKISPLKMIRDSAPKSQFRQPLSAVEELQESGDAELGGLEAKFSASCIIDYPQREEEIGVIVESNEIGTNAGTSPPGNTLETEAEREEVREAAMKTELDDEEIAIRMQATASWRPYATTKGNEHHQRLWGLKSNSPTPPVLYVCRESYKVASKSYSPCFSFQVLNFEQRIPRTYFNPRLDTLYLRYDHFGLKFCENPDSDSVIGAARLLCDLGEVCQIESLAILIEPEIFGEEDFDIEVYILGIKDIFPGVTKLTVVVNWRGIGLLSFLDARSVRPLRSKPCEECHGSHAISDEKFDELEEEEICAYSFEGGKLETNFQKGKPGKWNCWRTLVTEELLEWWRLEIIDIARATRTDSSGAEDDIEGYRDEIYDEDA